MTHIASFLLHFTDFEKVGCCPISKRQRWILRRVWRLFNLTNLVKEFMAPFWWIPTSIMFARVYTVVKILTIILMGLLELAARCVQRHSWQSTPWNDTSRHSTRKWGCRAGYAGRVSQDRIASIATSDICTWLNKELKVLIIRNEQIHLDILLNIQWCCILHSMLLVLLQFISNIPKS